MREKTKKVPVEERVRTLEGDLELVIARVDVLRDQVRSLQCAAPRRIEKAGDHDALAERLRATHGLLAEVERAGKHASELIEAEHVAGRKP